jgi:hypothetical protein
MKKSSYVCCLIILLLTTWLSWTAAGILADQKGIKSTEELTGNLSFLIDTNGDFLVYSQSAYSDHLHVFQVGTNATIRFFDQDTVPCGNANLFGLIPITTQGSEDIHHRFNQGICVRQTSTSPSTIRLHYNIE